MTNFGRDVVRRAFYILLALAVLSQFQLIFILSFFLVVPGFILLAANTLVYYLGGTLLFDRVFGIKQQKPWVLFVALGLAAIIPSAIGRIGLYATHANAMLHDFSKPAMIKPRSIELPVSWNGWQRPGNLMHQNWPDANEARPFCGDVCQALLYSGQLEFVVVTIDDGLVRDAQNKLVPLQRTWRFRIEHRTFCPELHTTLMPEYARRDAAGECLIEERADTNSADAHLKEIRLQEHRPKWRGTHKLNSIAYHWKRLKAEVTQLDFSRFAIWLTSAPPTRIEIHETVNSVKSLVERQTSVAGIVATIPFYVWVKSGGPEGWIPTVATTKLTYHPIERREILRRRYGFHFN